MNGMSRKELLSALDVLNAKLKLEFGISLEVQDLERGLWSIAGPYVPEYVCELRLTSDRYGRGRVLLQSNSSSDQGEARLSAWQGLLGHAGFPDASSGEELALKLSLLPDRDVRGMLCRIAYPERRHS